MASPARSALGSVATSFPWCCLAPAALAGSGVAVAGVGAAFDAATPLFLLTSMGLLGRALYLSLVRRRGPRWVRGVVLASAPIVVALWSVRLGTFGG